MYRRLVLLLAIAAVGFLPAALRAAERIDLALVLAVDSSGSVNQQRFEQQRKGYADALISKQVLQAILGGENKRIAVTYFEWSDGRRMARLVPWTLIDSETSAQAVSKIIREHRRQLVGDTCIPCAIDEAMTYFKELPYETDRKVLDISGDGESNVGGSVDEARDRALIADITINGLPIQTYYEPGLADYYEQHVIGGPGSFLIVARGFDDFARAVAAKLVREIAEVPRP
ncbi:MAG: DUF1194 domain-containing protein [Rhodospirillaceae bacterium]|nr:DUF1194 domain-containing protein [Rhodospirillaceae bacterium]